MRIPRPAAAAETVSMDASGDLAQIRVDQVAPLLARFDPRQVEQVDDELAHPLGPDERPIDDARDGGGVVAGGPVLQHAQKPLDRGQRRLQLVPEHGDELEADLPFLLGQAPGLALHQVVADGAPQGHAQVVGREGLRQHVVRATLGGLDGHLQRGVCRDHDRECLVPPVPDLLQDVEARHPRHLHVEQEDVRSRRRHHLQRRFAALGALDLKGDGLFAGVPEPHGVRAEDAGYGEPHPGFVVDHENAKGFHGTAPQCTTRDTARVQAEARGPVGAVLAPPRQRHREAACRSAPWRDRCSRSP